MVEGTGLENRHTGNRIEGSNPSLSAGATRIEFLVVSKNTSVFLVEGSNVNCISHHGGIRKAEAVYDFTKCNEVKLSPSSGWKFLTSGATAKRV